MAAAQCFEHTLAQACPTQETTVECPPAGYEATAILSFLGKWLQLYVLKNTCMGENAEQGTTLLS